ncbi:hypothetical protein F7734_58300 [Scytonema sp. UIC 10036]|uniref:hypothetical protein n=1 Tax=Scytonema sp. UIC 10036 TaxID=2304196 RepID=UPI0012DAD49D|nr:hypothetical protein [Scytonema sp. UIC 10036]MUH01505.1 hypothetical protein [Scytonema sp. UIC 10036]
MITNCKNWHRLLWLTSFLVATGAWAYLESHALAQTGGTLTALVINPDIVPRAIATVSDNSGSISLRSPTNVVLITSGGNISVNNGSISLTPVDSVLSTNGGNISLTPVDSVLNTNGGNISINAVPILLTPSYSVSGTSGGNISINAGTLILRRVPEKSSLLGLLAFAIFGAVSMYKCKQKSRQFQRHVQQSASL